MKKLLTEYSPLVAAVLLVIAFVLHHENAILRERMGLNDAAIKSLLAVKVKGVPLSEALKNGRIAATVINEQVYACGAFSKSLIRQASRP